MTAVERQSSGVRRLTGPVREFVSTQNASAVILLGATVAALLWANSPWSESYEDFWGTDVAVRFGDHELSMSVRHWVNDGLMAFFFFVVGLEIRREFDMGELRERRRLATPVVAAVGGMVVPALIYLAFNAGETSGHGWGIVMGTDTAFALGVLTLVGGSASPRVRNFLLTLVIVDDIVALTVIAIAYTDHISVLPMLVAVALFGVVLVLRRAGVRHGVPYFLVGTALWLAMLSSGVHATIAGVALGLLATAYPPDRAELQRVGALWRLFREQPTPEYARTASRSLSLSISPNERLQHLFHPWTSYVIVPVFALANVGVALNGEVIRDAASSPITLGIIFGLVIGKVVGITAATWLATRRHLGGFPQTIGWPSLFGVGSVAGIGFTVSLLIADITFEGDDLENAKLGVLGASIIASLLAAVVFRVIGRVPPQRLAAGEKRLAAPLVDLVAAVDPEVDHLRGPREAPITLVEYGDFECPYCGEAEPVVRSLLEDFGTELRFVFRNLPLIDVHEHALLAAEAAESAGDQGRYWEMHDLLFAHRDALELDDLRGYAATLGLDVERFVRDLRSRRHMTRVARDVEGADASGVSGTPTFFVNGRRHHGAYDLQSLTNILRAESERLQALRCPT